jgi:hypothetical protein
MKIGANSKFEQRIWGNEYIKELKIRMKCFNCGGSLDIGQQNANNP